MTLNLYSLRFFWTVGMTERTDHVWMKTYSASSGATRPGSNSSISPGSALWQRNQIVDIFHRILLHLIIWMIRIIWVVLQQSKCWSSAPCGSNWRSPVSAAEVSYPDEEEWSDEFDDDAADDAGKTAVMWPEAVSDRTLKLCCCCRTSELRAVRGAGRPPREPVPKHRTGWIPGESRPSLSYGSSQIWKLNI